VAAPDYGASVPFDPATGRRLTQADVDQLLKEQESAEDRAQREMFCREAVARAVATRLHTIGKNDALVMWGNARTAWLAKPEDL
jgi:hypothetical protein